MQPQATTATLWIVWFAIFSGLFIFQYLLGGGLPSGQNEGPLPTAIMGLGAGLFLLSVAIRWFLIPRTVKGGPNVIMPVMIIGIAFAEALVFFGIFLIPETLPQLRLGFFLTAIIGVAQFAPTYATKVE